VWGPCFPGRSSDKKVGSLCDAYAHHWDLEVLNVMKEENFVGIMGVPNATGLWQVADIRNNGILKIKWVQAKRLLLQKKAEDYARPVVERRVPPGQHDKITSTDLVILINMVFAPSHCSIIMNCATIAKSGVIPSLRPSWSTPRSARVVWSFWKTEPRQPMPRWLLQLQGGGG
jgi:hypothetical protein